MHFSSSLNSRHGLLLRLRHGLLLGLGFGGRRRGSRRRRLRTGLAGLWLGLGVLGLIVNVHGHRVPPRSRLSIVRDHFERAHHSEVIIIVHKAFCLSVVCILELFLNLNLLHLLGDDGLELVQVQVLLHSCDWITGHDSRRAFILRDDVPSFEGEVSFMGIRAIGGFLPLLVLSFIKVPVPGIKSVIEGDRLDLHHLVI